jgi:hypothetical protein
VRYQNHSEPTSGTPYIRCAWLDTPTVRYSWETGGYETSCGLGWFRHMLPSSYLACIGPNMSLLPNPPIINKNGPPRLTIARWDGQLLGAGKLIFSSPLALGPHVAKRKFSSDPGPLPQRLTVCVCVCVVHKQHPKQAFSILSTRMGLQKLRTITCNGRAWSRGGAIALAY